MPTGMLQANTAQAIPHQTLSCDYVKLIIKTQHHGHSQTMGEGASGTQGEISTFWGLCFYQDQWCHLAVQRVLIVDDFRRKQKVSSRQLPVSLLVGSWGLC